MDTSSSNTTSQRSSMAEIVHDFSQCLSPSASEGCQDKNKLERCVTDCPSTSEKCKNEESLGPTGKPTSESTQISSWTRFGNTVAVLYTDWYLFEIFCWCLGTFCVVGIAGVLAVYDGKPLPKKIPLGFTINAYVSVLAAVAKLAMAIPLEEALGAQKYLWFSTKTPRRPLMDFEVFSEASRGPFGALKLLRRTHARSISSLGAILMLLSMALDPFFQQLVALPSRPSLELRSQIPRVVEFVKVSQFMLNGTGAISSDITIDASIQPFYVPRGAGAPINAFCASEECSWPVFTTLGVCSQCKDISQLLDFGCRRESGDWTSEYSQVTKASPERLKPMERTSCGWFLNITSDNPMLMSGYPIRAENDPQTVDDALLMRQFNFHDPTYENVYWNGSYNFRHIPAPIANFAVVAARDLSAVFQNATPQAYECVMQWCTKTINSSYANGAVSERILSTFANETMQKNPLIINFIDGDYDYTFTKNLTITPPGQNETFTVGNISALASRFAMDDWVPTFLTKSNSSEIPIIRYRNDFTLEREGKLSEPTTVTPWLKGSVPMIVEEMSTNMSNALRNNRLWSEQVLGSGIYVTMVEIQWAWLAYPSLILLGTLVFLVTTIFQTWGSPVRKSSALTILRHGLSWDAKAELQATDSTQEIRAISKGLKVFFNKDKELDTIDGATSALPNTP